MAHSTYYDAIVIGGGIVGASTAWHLLEADLDDVLLLEKDTPASKASGRAAGHLSTYTSRKYPASIRDYSIDFHRRVANDHDDVSLRWDVDHVLAHSREGADRLESLYEDDPSSLELLTGAEIAARDTVFTTDDVVAALMNDDAVHTDPYSLTRAVVSEIEEGGATVRLEGVTDIERRERDSAGSDRTGDDRTDAGRTDGEFAVITDDTTYRTAAVVNAAGAWSGKIAAMVGVSLQVKPRTSQIAVLEPEVPIDIPMFHCPDLGLYGRQELNGDVLVGGGTSTEIPNPDTFSTNATEEFIQHVSEHAATIAKGLGNARLVNDWAGRCTATPDRKPLIGPTSVDGFYVCAGFNGGGVARSPFAGRLVAEYVTGKESSFPTDPYDPGRFSAGKGFEMKSASTDW